MGRFAEALADAQRLARGDARGIIVDTLQIIDVPDFSPEEIKALRHAAKMPQRLFAQCLGVTQKSVEAWEGGRSHPDGAARRLLGLLQNDPDFFSKVGIFRHERTDYATSRVYETHQ
jgi:putative transcriptional regulator